MFCDSTPCAEAEGPRQKSQSVADHRRQYSSPQSVAGARYGAFADRWRGSLPEYALAAERYFYARTSRGMAGTGSHHTDLSWCALPLNRSGSGCWISRLAFPAHCRPERSVVVFTHRAHQSCLARHDGFRNSHMRVAGSVIEEITPVLRTTAPSTNTTLGTWPVNFPFFLRLQRLARRYERSAC